jgi:transposase-like protein
VRHDVALAAAAYRDGSDSVRRVARAHGIAPSTLRRELARQGISLRPGSGRRALLGADLSVEISAELRAELRARAHAAGVTVSDLVREALARRVDGGGEPKCTLRLRLPADLARAVRAAAEARGETLAEFVRSAVS